MNDVQRLALAVEFAAERHIDQRRKGLSEAPYMNHLVAVAANVAKATEGNDLNLIIAAYLHDIVEDTPTPPAEVAERFGDDVAEIVVLVTDDKDLSKVERKRRTIENAPHKPARAKLLKLADLVANMRDLFSQPPTDWPQERVQAYFDWANEVAVGLRSGSPSLNAPSLLAEFDALYARKGELKAGVTTDPLSRVVRIAASAHLSHSPDKGGSSYILHPLRMMMRMTTDEARMVAVLHDVVEDHADIGWDYTRLEEEGVPPKVIEALRCVTKLSENEDYDEFIQRVVANPIAIEVKLADLEDNMNVLRLADLSDKAVTRLRKYHRSWKYLMYHRS